jgi:hypothetical protein
VGGGKVEIRRRRYRMPHTRTGAATGTRHQPARIEEENLQERKQVQLISEAESIRGQRVQLCHVVVCWNVVYVHTEEETRRVRLEGVREMF